MILRSMLSAVLLCAAGPLYAQGVPEMVTAKNPAEISITLMNAGYDIELAKDSLGDPMIRSELAGYPLRIYFFGCDEETHDGCDSLQFSTGFDRDEPWNPAKAIEISEQLRFAAVRLDSEGDPYISWDVLTGDGIPTAIFLESLRRFENAVVLSAEMAFADEE